MKKTALFMLILTAILLCGCGKETVSAPETTPAENITETETETIFVPDDLPTDLKFTGTTVNWYVGDYADAYWADFHAEELNGERINDVIYNSRQAVEERLDVKLEHSRKQVTYNTRLEISNDISASVMAGDNAYDVYSGYDLSNMILDGNYFHNLNDVKHINFDKPWWNKSMLNMLPGNKVFTALGDGSISLIKHTFCLFFNQDMLDAHNIPDNVYDLVHDGKWTFDKLGELINNTYTDLNGNGASDYGDFFGMTMGDVNKYIGWHFAAGGEMVNLTDTGYVLAAGSERMMNACEKSFELLRKNPDVMIPAGSAKDSEAHVLAVGGNYVCKTFMEGNALFTACLVGDAMTLLADVDFDYGLLPYPKYDETQKNYVSAVQRFASFSVPITADPDMSSAVIEAWSSEAYRSIQPEYFETVLKSRYSADNQMAGIFDLIRETIRFDIGDLFCDPLVEISSEPAFLLMRDQEGQWASTFASKEQGWNKTLQEIWEALS